MYCKLCHKFNTRNRQNQSVVWNKEPCVTIRKDMLSRHEGSVMHREALEQERACKMVRARGGIKEALDKQVTLQRQALIAAMKCLYWLCKQEIAHTTNYEPLLSLVKNLGCTHLSALNVGGNAHYTSERIIQELVITLAQQIEDSQLHALRTSPFYGLMIDESTDVSITKQLVLYGRYISELGEPCSTFLCIVDLVNGTAECIEEAIRAYLVEKELPTNKMMGFGSDGAAVMTGRVTGVATRLHHSNQYLVSIHCAAHRLALACSQTGEDVDYVSKFKRSLSTLFWFFQASPVRTSGLKAIHEMLNSTYLKLKEAKDVWWLSHDQAVQTLRRCLAAVLTALEREAAENGEAVAVGLVKVMKSYHFIACLHLMSEVLPHLSHLSRLFQGTYIQLSMIQPHLNACMKTLTSYRDAKTPPDVTATDAALNDELKEFNIRIPPNIKDTFNKHVRQPFLNLLLQNLNDRFTFAELLQGFDKFIPPPYTATDEERDKVSHNYKEKLQLLISHYGTGEDAPVSAEKLRKEWESFYYMLQDHYSNAKAIEVMKDLVNEKLNPVYPQLSCLANLALVIPINTADCERAFSTMKRVKTRIRNRLKSVTLDALLRISIQGPSLDEFDFESAVNKWSSITNRKIQT